jgi:hypothetical protein
VPACLIESILEGVIVVVVKLLNGSSVAHECKVIRMGDPNEVSIVAEAGGMTFEAWNLERSGDCFLATSWRRLT